MSDPLDFRRLEAVVVDMDGVLWRGNTPLPGLGVFFGFLRERGIPFVLATNNASKAPEVYVARLAERDVTVARNEILTSALATADYLRGLHPAGTPVYVVGGPGLRVALADAGFTVVENPDRPVEVVVAGIDFELTYEKLARAATYIQRGAGFVGTNPDPTYPSEEGNLPGAGTILAAIRTCTGVEPTVIGKPGRAMFDVAVARTGRPRERTAMVGDRLDTDVLGARRAGLATILVTTGVDDAAAIVAKGIRPDAVFDGLPALTEAWRTALDEAG